MSVRPLTDLYVNCRQLADFVSCGRCRFARGWLSTTQAVSSVSGRTIAPVGEQPHWRLTHPAANTQASATSPDLRFHPQKKLCHHVARALCCDFVWFIVIHLTLLTVCLLSQPLGRIEVNFLAIDVAVSGFIVTTGSESAMLLLQTSCPQI